MDELLYKYAVLMRNAGEEVLFGPFDTIEEVATWAGTAAVNIEFWACYRLYGSELVREVDLAEAMTAPDTPEP